MQNFSIYGISTIYSTILLNKPIVVKFEFEIFSLTCIVTL